MYLEEIEIENTGPISNLNLKMPFNENGSPRPVIFVGKNGSGKSITIAHIVSAMINAHGSLFEDRDVTEGKIYKIISPAYIKFEKDYSRSFLKFNNDFFEEGLMLRDSKKRIREKYGNISSYRAWSKILDYEGGHIDSNFHDSNKKEELTESLKGPLIYFPPNRFEEPTWLNNHNLKNRVEYFQRKNIKGISDRPVINYSPLKYNESWLLDVIYDVNVIIDGKTGKASVFLSAIRELIQLLFGEKTGIWSVGNRSSRHIGIDTEDKRPLIENLFNLSTGQTILFDFFLTILRHADLGGFNFTSLKDIKGLVVVDEIDLHLHTELQSTLLPKMIAMFPNIQFIMTSHSPLFLLGMENSFGKDGFKIVNLPNGEDIDVEEFGEFKEIYNTLAATNHFKNEILKANKPIVYVEGSTDVKYIKKAAELLDEKELLEKFEILDIGGNGNLRKLRKASIPDNLFKHKVILLFDCDEDGKNGGTYPMYKRIIPKQESHKIKKGIENLFPDKTIDRLDKSHPHFIDTSDSVSSRKRGKITKVPELCEINEDEKSNLCDWLCANSKKEDDDFIHFSKIFDIMREVLNSTT